MVPLLPYLVNGGPFIGDSWVHMALAEAIISQGRYAFQGYNTRWPLVNLLLAQVALTLRLPLLTASQAVPLLAGLTSIPLYTYFRRAGLTVEEALLAILFFTLLPLYPQVAFLGAVMKETAAFYQLALMLMLSVTICKRSALKPALPIFLLVSAGLTLGHHYGGLVAALLLTLLVWHAVLQRLQGRIGTVKPLVTLLIIHWSFLTSWNALTVMSIGAFFQALNVNDLALMAATITVTTALVAGGSRTSRLAGASLTLIACLIVVLGLRKGWIYSTLSPAEPFSVRELLIYAASTLLASYGALKGLRLNAVKALASATIGLVVYSVLWGFTYPGLVLLTKAAHYFALPASIFAGCTLASTLKRKGGRMLIAVLAAFIVYSASLTIQPALEGLGAYNYGEVTSAAELSSFMGDAKVVGDTKLNYLMAYFGLNVHHVTPLKEVGGGSLLALLRSNWLQGFLYGYEWAPAGKLLEQVDRYGRIYDSQHLKAFLT